ncbi:MAG: ImmA/IrrE family metallo-endopeptidase, partial [Planctomycetota bacterium]
LSDELAPCKACPPFRRHTLSANVAVEKFCNRVAAEFLVPAAKLREAWPTAPAGDEAFSTLARRFKVSPIVVARRAKDRKLIPAEEFFAFYKRYREDEESRSARKQSGGDFWNNQNTRVGRRFGRAVITAARDGRLPYSDAYDLTRLYGSTFDAFADLLAQKAGR